MLLIFDDCCGERQGTAQAQVGERDNEDIRRVGPLDVAKDAALVAGIGDVGDDLAGRDVLRICFGREPGQDVGR